MYGYYFFLGRGDWGTSRAQSFDPTFNGNVPTRILGDWGVHRQGLSLDQAPEWSSSWSVETWKEHVDFLTEELQADTFAICMNGYELPYPSTAFPEAVELDHANVKSEFFQQVLDYARDRGLALIATFCTTGHAKGYVASHPEAATTSVDGERSSENLCHNHPLGRHYARTVAEEMLTRYHGFNGICFHPPENTQPCYCSYCRDRFARATGKKMADATTEEVEAFFWQECLTFQQEMVDCGLKLVPDAQVYCVTIPGRFEPAFDTVAAAVPRDTTFLHWDYWNFGEKTEETIKSLNVFASRGHPVGFVASSGWSLDGCGADYGLAVVEQIRKVQNAGYTDLLYFVGAIWHEPSLLATSFRRAPKFRPENRGDAHCANKR